MANAHNPTGPYTGQQSRTGTRDEPGGVSDALRQAASGVGETAAQVKDRVQGMAANVADRVEDAWDSTRQSVSQGAQTVANTAGDFWTDATNMVRSNPMAAVMIAFAAGCLCASLFSVPRWDDDVARRMSRSSQ